ncbi:MAG: SGNH/GDSL hydrolase family protein, partial [Armatimonadota bacterium]|nr:SGNH/GDSL hydrolase family protein [Armatimonadota bacterium]
VWNLSRHSAGMCFQFETDAPEIRARWKVTSSSLAMVHMPATGASGLDLYGETEPGRFRWAGVGRPTAQETEAVLAAGLLPGRRTYRVYLPLYNRTERVEVGVPAGAHFRPIAPRRERPLLFYGTSIVHGGCASRPGMAHPAILGRRLNLPTLNLGFSGNGQMEPEVADLLAELDPCVYVIDCLPNMQAELVAARAEPLVRTLRKARPRTPIVLVEDRTYANAPLLPAQRKRNDASRAALRNAYQRLTAEGMGDLHYVPGENLLGDDGEATVDGSHPTDLGFFRMADALEPLLRRLCGV